MPTFHIELFEGRSLEQKRQFVEAITKATCESLGVEPNSVDIILTDVKRENWARVGVCGRTTTLERVTWHLA